MPVYVAFVHTIVLPSTVVHERVWLPVTVVAENVPATNLTLLALSSPRASASPLIVSTSKPAVIKTNLRIGCLPRSQVWLHTCPPSVSARADLSKDRVNPPRLRAWPDVSYSRRIEPVETPFDRRGRGAR